MWPRLDTIVRLDYRLHIIIWRLLSRTLRRSITREELWNGNRENFYMGFLTRDSPMVWALRNRGAAHRVYSVTFNNPDYAYLKIVRLKSPSTTRDWLSSVKSHTQVDR